MKYFKIITGYDSEDYLEVDETELEKAYYCFLEKKDSIFSGGACKGSQILLIKPDFNRAMGWNRGYKLGPDDYAELKSKGLDRSYRDLLADVENKVQHLIQTKQTNLIGKNVDIKKLESENDGKNNK